MGLEHKAPFTLTAKAQDMGVGLGLIRIETPLATRCCGLGGPGKGALCSCPGLPD